MHITNDTEFPPYIEERESVHTYAYRRLNGRQSLLFGALWVGGWVGGRRVMGVETGWQAMPISIILLRARATFHLSRWPLSLPVGAMIIFHGPSITIAETPIGYLPDPKSHPYTHTIHTPFKYPPTRPHLSLVLKLKKKLTS